MQQYDVAMKILIESCQREIVRKFLDINVRESALIKKVPQETVSVKRSDYPLLVTDSEGRTWLVILEIQTFWNRHVPLNLLDYRIRHLLDHDMEAVSCVILLRPSPSATDQYNDREVTFKYRLVKIFEMDARETVDNGPLCLMPFVPLMKNGKAAIEEADSLICESELPKLKKADMLTSMAILSGLVSDELPANLISRRKDIMMESAAYDIIKQEGIQLGINQGRREGLMSGLMAMLEMKFGLEGKTLESRIGMIEDTNKIKEIMEAVKLSDSPEDILKLADME